MQALTDLNTYVKPACAAGAILFIDKFITKSPNMQQSIYLAGGVGAGFFVAKIVSPYIPALNLGLGSFGGFDTQAIENRIIELSLAGGALYGLNQAKLINLSYDKQNLVTLGATILVADMLSEEVLPFLGYHSK